VSKDRKRAKGLHSVAKLGKGLDEDLINHAARIFYLTSKILILTAIAKNNHGGDLNKFFFFLEVLSK